MNVYVVTYRKYSGSIEATFTIVARNIVGAMERARVIHRKKNYGISPHEITSVTKTGVIDGVQK